MRTRTTAVGALFATITALAWGGQFVVGKSALGSVNAFPLSTIRYAVAALLWLVVLAAVEGPGALRLEGGVAACSGSVRSGSRASTSSRTPDSRTRDRKAPR